MKYSRVALKTTTEGWIIMNRLNNYIENAEDKPLNHMTVQKTSTGFYKISNNSIEWEDTYSQMQNFYLALDKMTKQDIPFVFIRIGSDTNDIEIKDNWTYDMPDELDTFEPKVSIQDTSKYI